MKMWVDGSVGSGDPGGVIGYGWHTDTEEGHGILFQGGTAATNNISEYGAVAAGLIWLLPRVSQFGDKTLEILSDSQLTVNQLSGEWRVRHSNLKPIAALTHLILDQFTQLGWDVTIRWIPREENKRADKLSRKTLNTQLMDRLPLTRREESE